MWWVATTIRDRWRVISGVLAVQNLSIEPTVAAGLDHTSIAKLEIRSPHQEHAPPRDIGVALKNDYNSIIQTRRLPLNQHTQRPRSHGGSSTHGSESSEYAFDLSKAPPKPKVVAAVLEDRFMTLSNPDRLMESLGPRDWTVPNHDLQVNSYTRFFRNFDWASSKLGPIDGWSIELRRMANILLSDPRPAAMYWTEERVMMYNEAYKNIAGIKHPWMLGKPFDEAWAELGSALDIPFERAKSGLSYARDDACYFIDRAHFIEETYFSTAIIPIPAESGDIAYYNPVYETTKHVVSQRRISFLYNLGQRIAPARNSNDFWSSLIDGLESNIHEVPFALVYSAVDEDDSLSASSEITAGSRSWTLEGAIGYPSDHPGVLKRLDADSVTETFLPTFRDAIRAFDPTLLSRSDGSLPDTLVDGVYCRAFGDRCDAAVLCPIRSSGENVLGFLLLGVDPRRPSDDGFHMFIQLLCRQLTTSLASAVLFEEEHRRNRLAAHIAAVDRHELSQQLAIRTHEAIENENRFRRMADLAPVGMFHFSSDGMPIYANENWYEITQHPRGAEYPMSWYNVIVEEDHAMMDLEWARLSVQGQPVSFEIRLRKPFSAAENVGGEKVEGVTWIIAAAYPERSKEGRITGILGCITDISRQKWAEDFQTRRMQEALELKRQQENFIDMTSHEIRNPLSAIVQCADWIGSSLSEFQSVTKDVTIPKELVDSMADAAQTVVLCAQHQKRIIDDILTLSKLDSNLLLITPVNVQPAQVIENTLRMFDGELQKSDVELRFRIEPSYRELGVDWVRLDPSRLLQVLINLTTNAIKFTQSEKTRKIVIKLGASLVRPTQRNGLTFLPRHPRSDDATISPDWGPGELLYLIVEVCDTGRGLSEIEKTLLFQRFSQTSPRTHVQYGGSGLGLFISRELTERQGGEIGVRSEAGEGSTFAFFVRAHRTSPPDSITTASSESNLASLADKIVDLSAIPEATEPPVSKVVSKKREIPTISNACKHVLVVEDNLVNQKVLSKQLQSAGCIVSVANHGGEALKFLEKSRFWTGNTNGTELSIILMDLEMPVMDGLTCVKLIRDMQRTGKITGHVPVIAVTANARSEQVADAKEAGMVSSSFNHGHPDASDLCRTAW